MFYKRKNKVLIIVLCLINFALFFNLSGCKDTIPPISEIEIYSDFSVNFLDVGQGDCIFIRLPDGENMLIDCGLNDYYDKNVKFINTFLNKYKVKTIDYFILTHPDVDHIGNACAIINNFDVKRVYIPYVYESLLPNFATFNQTLDLIQQKNIPITISDYTCFIKGNDYSIAFLSPLPKGIIDSSYDDILLNKIPTETHINNLSPIIYFECFSKRFLFTGDAERKQELLVKERYNLNIYEQYFRDADILVNLEDIDYLKLSHHGSKDASCLEFLSLLNPKNIIISVGNENYYGHPASETLERILLLCPNTLIYRTDREGTISIHKSIDNAFSISTAKNK